MKALTPARVHLARRSPRLMRHTFLSFRPQPRDVPGHRFIRHYSVTDCFQTSPRMSKLVAAPRRNRFVILRTDSSLPVAPHPALTTDAVTFSYGAVAHSGTDLHRADIAPSRAHSFQ